MKRIMFKYIEMRLCGPIAILLLFATVVGCDKSHNEPVEIYPDPPEAKVKFQDALPSPSVGAPGSEVTFQISGLEGKEGQFTFFINQVEAEVLEVTENSVRVVVPNSASTGGSSVLMNSEFYFGPTFTIRGKVSIDPTFNPSLIKSNGGIDRMIRWKSGIFAALGTFTDYQTQATPTKLVPGFVLIDSTSLEYNNTGATESQLNIGKQGIVGFINDVVPVADDKYLLAGSISQYDTIRSIGSITRIYGTGNVDSMVVDVIGEAPLDKMTVPAFNGGVGGTIVRAFYDQSSRDVTVIGNFNFYTSVFYERSSVGGLFNDITPVSQIARMDETGAFDSSFNYDYAAKKAYEGANGFIYDALQLSDGDYLIAGNFTSFRGKSVQRIGRISNSDGSVVTSFSGSADGAINKLNRSPVSGNILLVGAFKNFNGQPVNQVAMINENGEIVPEFSIKETDGIINFAGQMKDGKVIISGTFTKYGDTIREGLAILNADGSLAEGYNNFGLFRGQVNGFIESTTPAGQKAVVLYGSFDKFDGKTVGNIVKIRIED